MAKRSIGKGKVEQETMVVCPKCGGREFEFVIDLGKVNLYRILPKSEDLCIQYEAVSIDQVARLDTGFSCSNCLAKLDQQVD